MVDAFPSQAQSPSAHPELVLAQLYFYEYMYHDIVQQRVHQWYRGIR
jgi:hypothetical protein